jgi:hypothetical protein
MVYKSNFGKLLSNIERNVRDEVKVQSAALENEARSLILEPKSGRWYGSHRASAPGEPWANWTGETRSTFFNEQRDGGFTGVFGATSPVAKYLEYGTERISPRPTFRPSLANRRNDIVKSLAAALRNGTRL